MAEYRYVTLDVFTDRPFGGNQLAVFPDAEGIPEERLQAIAQEFNYSETVFCYRPADPGHTARVRIFTPNAELPFAGHPTVGTAIALRALRARGRGAGQGGPPGGAESRLVLEEGVGPVSVLVRTDGETPFAQLSAVKLPEIGPLTPSRSMLAELLSLDTEDVLGGTSAPQAVSCGLPFLLVPLKSVKAVSRSRLRIDKWEATLKTAWARDLLVFAKDSGTAPNHLRARCFVPGFSVPEDPATGSANACLAGYLAARSPERDGTLAWSVDQGIEMGRPSRLELEADKRDGAVTAIRVGGRAVFVMEGVLRLE